MFVAIADRDIDLLAGARSVVELTGAMDEIVVHRVFDTVRDAVAASTTSS